MVFRGNTSTLLRRGAPYYITSFHDLILPKVRNLRSLKHTWWLWMLDSWRVQVLAWLPQGLSQPETCLQTVASISFHKKQINNRKITPSACQHFRRKKYIKRDEPTWMISPMTRNPCPQLLVAVASGWFYHRFWRQKLLKPELYPRSPRQLLFKTVITYRLRHVEN